MTVKHKTQRVRKFTRVMHVVEHTHTRSDGTTFTHEHAQPQLRHLELKNASRVDADRVEVVSEDPEWTQEKLGVDDEEWTALNTDFTVTVSGRFDIDPYGSMIAALGLTLTEVYKNRGKLGDGTETDNVKQLIDLMVSWEEEGVLPFTAEEFESWQTD